MLYSFVLRNRLALFWYKTMLWKILQGMGRAWHVDSDPADFGLLWTLSTILAICQAPCPLSKKYFIISLHSVPLIVVVGISSYNDMIILSSLLRLKKVECFFPLALCRRLIWWIQFSKSKKIVMTIMICCCKISLACFQRLPAERSVIRLQK